MVGKRQLERRGKCKSFLIKNDKMEDDDFLSFFLSPSEMNTTVIISFFLKRTRFLDAYITIKESALSMLYLHDLKSQVACNSEFLMTVMKAPSAGCGRSCLPFGFLFITFDLQTKILSLKLSHLLRHSCKRIASHRTLMPD